MTDINPTISIFTLNINDINASIKRQRLSEWIKKYESTTCCPKETHLKYKDMYKLIINGWRKIYLANTNQKRTGVAILHSERAHFKARKVIRDREVHYIMIKGSTLQEQ